MSLAYAFREKKTKKTGRKKVPCVISILLWRVIARYVMRGNNLLCCKLLRHFSFFSEKLTFSYLVKKGSCGRKIQVDVIKYIITSRLFTCRVREFLYPVAIVL